MRDKAYLTIVDNQLTMQGGVPLDRFPGFSGRYINGTYTLDISLDDGELKVVPTDFAFEEVEISDDMKREIVNMLKEENMAAELLKKKEISGFVESIEKISIENSRVLFAR